MKVLLASSEATPFAKTGGLGDVCGALPRAIAELGHQVAVILPAYRQIHKVGAKIVDTGVRFEVPIGNKMVAGGFLKSVLPGSGVPIYFVEQNEYFDRPELYGEGGVDYKDNCERFVFFSRAVLEAIRKLGLSVDVLHVNDWQTALAPALLKIEHAGVPPYENIASLLTIHNLAYQGVFWHWDMLLTGLDWKYFNWQQMEFFGNLNLLKTGLVFADRINTVSPRYAEEIQSAPLSCGLEGLLTTRRSALSGIINGVDYSEWNPASDPHLAANYSVDTIASGKPACKAALQAAVGLPTTPDVPLIGFIGRLVEQKGIDLMIPVLREFAQSREAQWVILGSGDPTYEEQLRSVAERIPRRVAVKLEFSNALAHQIEAGADMFVMPSRYEPCGLNQLYSLKYGTPPIVRATGGLVDTVTDTNEATLAAGVANGFSFRESTSLALGETLNRACSYFSQPDLWRRIMTAGMREDHSWTASARAYVELYQTTVAQVRQTALV